MTETYYHASGQDLGEEFTFNEGGIYELIEDGYPVQKRIGGEYIGWGRSKTEQLCASESPEAATFAKAKNISFDIPEDAKGEVTIYVYELKAEPDIDLTNAVSGDFGFLEEVRYNNPAENPISGVKSHTITLSKKTLKDIGLAYCPDGPYIVREWAEALKKAVKQLIETGEFPDNIVEFAGCKRPDPLDHQLIYSKEELQKIKEEKRNKQDTTLEKWESEEAKA